MVEKGEDKGLVQTEKSTGARKRNHDEKKKERGRGGWSLALDEEINSARLKNSERSPRSKGQARGRAVLGNDRAPPSLTRKVRFAPNRKRGGLGRGGGGRVGP